MRVGRYEVHGLVLESELELDAHPATDSANVDYRVVWGDGQIGSGRPPGRVISQVELPGVSSWLVDSAALGAPSQLLLRVAEVAEFEISDGRITVRPATDALAGHAPILLTGTVISRLLGVAGRLVLHASAVELGGGAIALLGDSGMGKSTTAAHLCVAGTPFLTDDALTVDLAAEDGPRCFRGTNTIRLRKAARSQFAEIEPWLRGMTADERLAIRPPATPRPSLPLRAMVVIERPHDQSELTVERIAGVDAAAQLLRYPRSFGWVDSGCLRSQFDLTAQLAGHVPVLVARLPTTAQPSDRSRLGRQLLDAIATISDGYPAASGE